MDLTDAMLIASGARDANGDCMCSDCTSARRLVRNDAEQEQLRRDVREADAFYAELRARLDERAPA